MVVKYSKVRRDGVCFAIHSFGHGRRNRWNNGRVSSYMILESIKNLLDGFITHGSLLYRTEIL